MGSEWKSIRLGDVIEVNPQRILNAEKTHPYIPMDAIPSWSRKVSRIERRSERSGSKFKNGDVLLARITPCLENGKTAYVDMLKDDEVGVGSTEFIVLHGKEGITDNLFVYYLSRTESFRSHAIKSMSGTSGRQRVPNSAIENYEFFLPPLDEQKRIAHILGTLDDKIELNRRMNETLEAMARALFKAWFVDFEPVKAKMNGEPYPLPDEIMDLFPDELVESELGLIPKGWKVGKVDDFVSTYGGGTPSTKVPDYWESGIYPFVTPKDLSNNQSLILMETERKVTEKGLSRISSGLLPEGTVLMSSRAPIGYLAITGMPVCVNQGFIAIVCNKELSNYFILNWLRINLGMIKGRAGGTTFLEINKQNFRSIPLVFSKTKLIKNYDEIINPLIFKIIANFKETQRLLTIRNKIISELISLIP